MSREGGFSQLLLQFYSFLFPSADCNVCETETYFSRIKINHTVDRMLVSFSFRFESMIISSSSVAHAFAVIGKSLFGKVAASTTQKKNNNNNNSIKLHALHKCETDWKRACYAIESIVCTNKIERLFVLKFVIKWALASALKWANLFLFNAFIY